jgi:hypothetical protein
MSAILSDERVDWAAVCEKPPFAAQRKRGRASLMNGIRFEKQVLDHLEKEIEKEKFFRQVWMMYQYRGDKRYCQLDALEVVDKDTAIIYEIKLRHCAAAERQLFDLYLPVVRTLLSRPRLLCIEIVRYFDISTMTGRSPKIASYSERKAFLETLSPGEFGVLTWPIKL